MREVRGSSPQPPLSSVARLPPSTHSYHHPLARTHCAAPNRNKTIQTLVQSLTMTYTHILQGLHNFSWLFYTYIFYPAEKNEHYKVNIFLDIYFSHLTISLDFLFLLIPYHHFLISQFFLIKLMFLFLNIIITIDIKYEI